MSSPTFYVSPLVKSVMVPPYSTPTKSDLHPVCEGIDFSRHYVIRQRIELELRRAVLSKEYLVPQFELFHN
ncbi:MAG: hypothetical protein NTW91_04665 [Verrucomicrobia bacterium]|nr:hypothetical protein [Verrucomicrobiota bacterium]